jgi:hypothetical protein
MEDTILRELDIQVILYNWYLLQYPNIAICPNCLLFKWEADVLVITDTQVIYEYEIKSTRADFLGDKKKDKHSVITGKHWPELSKPHYFYYVTGNDIVTLEDIPEYAGWIRVADSDGLKYCVHEKKAPPLRSKLATQTEIEKVQIATIDRCFKYMEKLSGVE